MPRGECAAFFLALANSGCAGLPQGDKYTGLDSHVLQELSKSVPPVPLSPSDVSHAEVRGWDAVTHAGREGLQQQFVAVCDSGVDVPRPAHTWAQSLLTSGAGEAPPAGPVLEQQNAIQYDTFQELARVVEAELAEVDQVLCASCDV